MVLRLQVEHQAVQLLYHEFAPIEAFIRDVEDRILVGWLVVHVEDYVCLGNRDDLGDVAGSWPDSGFADGDVHVGCVSFEQLHRSE